MHARTSPLVALLATLTLAGAAGGAPAPTLQVRDRLAVSKNLQIVLTGGGKPEVKLTSGHRDWKPIWNARGDQLAFFRTTRDLPARFEDWKAALMVVNADGTGERQLTAGEGRSFNPTWTRDGTNRILFNEYAPGGDAGACEAYVTTPDGKPGSALRISNPENKCEWVNSGLKDGRVLVDTIDTAGMRSWILTPKPGGVGKYEELQRPTAGWWHKVSVSPTQTKVVYMLDHGFDMQNYGDDEIYWAELDLEHRVVKNPVRVTPPPGLCANQYPRWTADEKFIVYDSTCEGIGRIYAFRLSDGVTAPISPKSDEWYDFPCAQGAPM